MAFGATVHQKEKVLEAPVDVHSVDFCGHSERSSKSFSNRQGDREVGKINIMSYSRRECLDRIEAEAKAQWHRSDNPKTRKSFLKSIPWHTLQRESQNRPEKVVQSHHQTRPPAYVVFGAFMHGGIVGVTRVTQDMPFLTRLLVQEVQSLFPDFQGTSVAVACNNLSPPHRDSHNLKGTCNWVVPLVVPESGGSLWVEDGEAGGKGSGFEVRKCGQVEVKGSSHAITSGFQFRPQLWHATNPWKGDRAIIVGYSISGQQRLQPKDRVLLRNRGFPLPRKDFNQVLWNLEARPLKHDIEETPSPQGAGSCKNDTPDNSEGDAGEVAGIRRDAAHQLDQGSAQCPTLRVDSRAGGAGRDDDHREGRGEDDQPLQEEGGTAGDDDRQPARIQCQHDHGPHEKLALPAPDGDSRGANEQGVHGVRQTLQPHLCDRDQPSSELCKVVHSNGDRRAGSTLAIEEVRHVGQWTQQDRERKDPPTGGQSECRISDQDMPTSTSGDKSIRELPGALNRVLGDGCHSGRCHLGLGDGAGRGHGADPQSPERAPSSPAGDGQPRDITHSQGEESAQLGETISSEDVAGEDLAPIQKLPFQVARSIGQEYERSLMSSLEELAPRGVMLLEVGGSSESHLRVECEQVFGKGSAVSLSQWNGGELETTKGVEYIVRTLKETKPKVLWISPDSTAFSPWQKLNQRSHEQISRLQAKREQAMLQYKGVAEIFQAAQKLGITCVLEMTEHCEAWQQPWYRALSRELELYEGVCQGCQVNLRDFQGAMLCKGWRLASTDGALVQNMSLVCDGRHSRGRCTGESCKQTAGYTREFARRVIRYMERKASWFETAKELQSGEGLCMAVEDSDECTAKEPSPEKLQDISSEKRKKIFQHLRRIHNATGHCSLQYLIGSLKKRGASKEVLRCAENFRCDVCAERRRPDPRSQATLNELVPKWHTVQCDAFSWNHPETQEKWQVMIGIDEGSRLRVARLLFQHQSRTPGMKDFVEFLEGNWLPYFGKPQVLRLDPAGCFRSKELDSYLSERSIEVQHIPAEAHWQISLAERTVQTLKNVMSALVSEQPQMSTSEALSRALWASNNRDQYQGYSPLQHAFGRAPDEMGHLGENKLRDIPILTEHGVSAEFGNNVKTMLLAERTFLEEQAKERLRRAELSGNRVMKNFCPGDLVFVWRRMTPKQDGGRHFKGGGFVGPYRVLATESRVGEKEIRPGHVIWLYRGGQLIKASPQQLRPASEREESWAELQEGVDVPWTLSDCLKKQPPHQYEDVTKDAQNMPKPQECDEEHEEHRPLYRIIGKQHNPQRTQASQVHHRSRSPNRRPEDPNNNPEVTPKGRPNGSSLDTRSRSPLTRGRPVARQVPLSTADFMEECGVVFPTEESAFWAQERQAVTMEIELPHVSTKRGKEWVRDLGCYFVKQLRKNAVEISEKHLTQAEYEGFQKAKQKEVKNFIVARAFQKLPSHMKPSKNQILKMRWILTWKLDEGIPENEVLKRDSLGNPLKPKARAVVLGYMDPQYEHRPTSSPTMGRTTRQLFLQQCANAGFQVEKGDISGAFLQGDEFGPDRPMVCEPLPEICSAVGVSPGSPMLLTRAAYGLVEAPIQWFLSVSRFLESIGGERQLSDPCCWGFFKEDRTPIGWVCGHVDDFLFGGRAQDAAWEAIKKKIRERFKWGQWESKRFCQCGVLIEQDESGFLLSQPDYLETISEIHVSKSRWQDPSQALNETELQQLRSVLGALSWHANQVAPIWSAPVSLMLSRIHRGTVNEILETNKLLRKAKLAQHQKMRIHAQPHAPKLLAAWVDAADSHRPDGSSTKGIFIGWTDEKLLKGDLVRISPIFWQSAKIQRVCRSSGSAETHAAVDADDELYAVRFQVYEFQGGQVALWSCDDAVSKVPGVLISDSKNLYDRLSQTVLTLKGAEKRTDIASLCLKESMTSTKMILRWVNGDSQLANSLTKETELHQYHEYLRRDGQWRIVYDPELLSGRKRKQLGLGSLEQKSGQ